MENYLHNFNSIIEFGQSYYGEDYHEPWVSLTKTSGESIVTSCTLVIMVNNTPVLMKYIFDSVLWTEGTVLDENRQIRELYAKYVPEDPSFPTAYSIVPPSELEDYNPELMIYGRYTGHEFKYPHDGPFNCETGYVVYDDDVAYNKPTFSLIGNYDGDDDYEGFPLDIIRDDIAGRYPYVPEEYCQDLYVKFTVNGNIILEGYGLGAFDDQGGDAQYYRFDVDGWGWFTYSIKYKTITAYKMPE